jgi:hypothetical protein
MSERGSFLPVVVLALAVTVAGAMLLASLVRATGDRARAQTAADAAALAGVVEGPGAAGELATANGGELLEFRQEGDEAVVRVRVGRAVAEARAGLELGVIRFGDPLGRTLLGRER